ncbi:MAG: glycan-binding surface protein [Candidatus Omnitrophota bacterium]
MKKFLLVLALLGFAFMAGNTYAEDEVVLFGFENGVGGWDIPDWAYEKPDHVQKEIELSDKYANEGKKSLEMDVEFPGGRWTGAIIEVMEYFDWTDFSAVACDIYIPKDAPLGLRAKMILTVGDQWKWVEMSKSYALTPGKWVTLRADIKPGSLDWRRVQVDDEFRKDVRKIDIRVESNNKPEYTGPIYIDNIRVVR